MSDKCPKPSSSSSSLYSNLTINNFTPIDNNDLKNLKSFTDTTEYLKEANSVLLSDRGGPKVECVYSLLSVLGSQSSYEISQKFLELSTNQETCIALRRSGCIPYLVQLQHSDANPDVRRRAEGTLYNIVNCCSDDKRGRREKRVLNLIQNLNSYSELLKNENKLSDLLEQHPIQSLGTLMKISFDEENRQTMCMFGAIQALSTIVQLDHEIHGVKSENYYCITLRRYAGMTLTNLTFGDGNNKVILCGNQKFMKFLIEQSRSNSEELVQVTASVIRNLSWRADFKIKEVLNSLNTVTVLIQAAMQCHNENTLKAILSALWNLSNSPQSKEKFCECIGAINFIVEMLEYKSSCQTLSIVENAGGVLRNISSLIAVREDYRRILREKKCFLILLDHLKSTSLTIVTNAIGSLGNLSAHCEQDQNFLIENGAIRMLKSLITSKHKLISTGSSQTLRNLLNIHKISEKHCKNVLNPSSALQTKNLASLNIRKLRAYQNDFDGSLPSKSLNQVKLIEENVTVIRPMVPYNLKNSSSNAKDYQEISGDQLTDFSKRYAELNNEPDELAKPTLELEEDQLQIFQTEGTPHIGSSFGSASDIRDAVKNETNSMIPVKLTDTFPNDAPNATLFKKQENSGCLSPERPTRYCDEGTPGRFSRSDSNTDLTGQNIVKEVDAHKTKSNDFKSVAETNDETPLMFSRTSSIVSLGSSWPNINVDDKSSIQSDFSQICSGIISPSEIPESPLESYTPSKSFPTVNPIKIETITENLNCFESEVSQDKVDIFCVEDTPRQFSSKTSLSNLSIDEEKIIVDSPNQLSGHLEPHTLEKERNISNEVYSDPEDDNEFENDDTLLESTVNIGMKTIQTSSKVNLISNSGSDIHEMLLESVIMDGILGMSMTKENHSTNNYAFQLNNLKVRNKHEARSVVEPRQISHSFSSEESCDSLDDSRLLDQLVQNGIDKVTNYSDGASANEKSSKDLFQESFRKLRDFDNGCDKSDGRVFNKNNNSSMINENDTKRFIHNNKPNFIIGGAVEKQNFVLDEKPFKAFPSTMSNSEIIIEEANRIVSNLENLSIESITLNKTNASSRRILDLWQNIDDINSPSILHEDCSLDVDSFIFLEEKLNIQSDPVICKTIAVQDTHSKLQFGSKPQLPIPPTIDEVLQFRENPPASTVKLIKTKSRLQPSNFIFKQKTNQNKGMTSFANMQKTFTRDNIETSHSNKTSYKSTRTKGLNLLTKNSIPLADTCCSPNFSNSKMTFKSSNQSLEKRLKEPIRSNVFKAGPNFNQSLPLKSKVTSSRQNQPERNTIKSKIGNQKLYKSDSDSLSSNQSFKTKEKSQTSDVKSYKSTKKSTKLEPKLERNNTFIMEKGTSLNIPIVSSSCTQPISAVKTKIKTTSVVLSKNLRLNKHKE